MMKLNLNTVIKQLNGRPFVDQETKNPITTRDMLLQYLGTYRSNDGKELIAAAKLGREIYSADEEFHVDDNEIKVLKKSIAEPQHVAAAYLALIEQLGMIEEK